MSTLECWNTFLLPSNGVDTQMDLDLVKDFTDYDLNLSYDDIMESCRSLHDDIKQIESSGSVSPSDVSVTSEPEIDIKPKVEIRNVDCMWSGLGLNSLTNNGNSNGGGNNERKTNQKQQMQQRQNQQNSISNVNYNSSSGGVNGSNNTNSYNGQKLSAKNIQNIPPGASLLINSRLNQQKKTSISSPSSNKYNCNSNSMSASSLIPNILATDFLRERETNLNSTSSSTLMSTARPDTPLSLDDDAPEFKHSVDLAACITGSNNICLDLNMQETTDKMIINKLREQLEDTSTENIDIRQIIPGNGSGKTRSLTEVLHAIGSVENEEYFSNSGHSSSSSHCGSVGGIIASLNNFSNVDSLTTQMIKQQQQQMIYDGGMNTAPDSELSQQSSSESEGDDDDDDDVEDDDDDAEISSSSCRGLTNGSSNMFRTPVTSQFRKNNNYTTYIDHSYTRSNDSNVDVVGIGLETPSDSDEEIDVVSVGDKKLPTNPSDKDRRALQNKVANKISARIVKTPNGIRTIPARKRSGGTFDPPFSVVPISGMVTSPIKSISVGGANSRLSNSNNCNSGSIKSQNNYNDIRYNSSISAGRKRNSQTTNGSNSSNGALSKHQQNDEYLPPSKRSRNNCNTSSAHTNSSNPNGSSNSSLNSSSHNSSNNKNNNRKSSNGKRNYDMEEQDTIEKRNLHNDMERQRRIGLKNLFEELKKQIPSIKDKERAPKVHILREAAKLCEQLMHEEKTIANQKNQLLMQIHRKKEYLEAKCNSK